MKAFSKQMEESQKREREAGREKGERGRKGTEEEEERWGEVRK